MQTKLTGDAQMLMYVRLRGRPAFGCFCRVLDPISDLIIRFQVLPSHNYHLELSSLPIVTEIVFLRASSL